MFDHLVESASHKDDMARRGSFILGTLVIYGVILLAAFVAGIYWYDAHLENQNLELTTLVAPVPVEETPQKQEEAPKPQKVSEQREVATVKEFTSMRPELVTEKAKVVTQQAPPIKGAVLGKENYIPTGATADPFGGTGNGTASAPAAPSVPDEPPPPPPKPPEPKPTPAAPRAPVSGGVLNGKAISLPKPAYPAIARTAHASGTVTVQVTIDESGKVISAKAVGGHPLLQAAAVQAAYGARFSPTMLSGQPVKVTGVITYNFLPQ